MLKRQSKKVWMTSINSLIRRKMSSMKRRMILLRKLMSGLSPKMKLTSKLKIRFIMKRMLKLYSIKSQKIASSKVKMKRDLRDSLPT